MDERTTEGVFGLARDLAGVAEDGVGVERVECHTEYRLFVGVYVKFAVIVDVYLALGCLGCRRIASVLGIARVITDLRGRLDDTLVRTSRELEVVATKLGCVGEIKGAMKVGLRIDRYARLVEHRPILADDADVDDGEGRAVVALRREIAHDPLEIDGIPRLVERSIRVDVGEVLFGRVHARDVREVVV